MRGKSLALLLLALGCGLVASLGITQVMARRSGDPTASAGEMQSVLVATKEVVLGDPLTAKVVKVEEWPKDTVPVGALARVEDAEGRRVRAKFYKGEPILEQKLFPKGMEMSGADALIPKGYRVATVKVDAVTGGGNLILPGSRVDLLVHMARNPAIGIMETTTKTVLQDLRVFAVNDVVSMETVNGQENKSIQARTVSLLVTPAQAEKVTLATEMGQIRLVMRSPEEDKQEPTRGATPQELFGGMDGAQRDKESLLPLGTTPDVTQKGKGFLEFLGSMKKAADNAGPPGASTEAHRDTVTWSMRVLKGAEVNEVELEGGDQLTAIDPDFSFWKVKGTQLTSAAKPDKQPEAAKLPPPDGPKPAKPTEKMP
jgi:pilus assembly protein CpaB